MPALRSRSIRSQLPWEEPTPPGPATFDVPDWMDQARCSETDAEAFFPEKGGSTRYAKKVCMACEVRTDCLEWAIATDQRFGVWGGMSERERRKIKQDRAETTTEVAA